MDEMIREETGSEADRPVEREGADVDEVREAAGQIRGRGAPADAVEPRPRCQPLRELHAYVRPSPSHNLLSSSFPELDAAIKFENFEPSLCRIRSQLYERRSSQGNTHFNALAEINKM